MPLAHRPLLAPALSLLLAGACGDNAPAGADDSSSSGDETPESSSGEGPTTTAGTPADDSSTATSADVTGSSSDTDPLGTTDATDTSGTTGDTEGETQAALELLVQAQDAGGHYRFYRWRTSEDGIEGPTQIVPSDDAHWTSAELFADRRIVYRAQVGSSDHDLHLGDLDDPDSLVQLDVAPMIAGELGLIIPIADDALLILGDDQDELFRIDFPGGVPQPPVLVAASDAGFYTEDPVVDPTGRWVAVPVPSIAGVVDVALARMDAPDPDGVTLVSNAGPGEAAVPMAIDSAGESLFILVDASAGPEIQHVDIRGDVPAPTTVAQSFAPTDFVQRLVPRPSGDGLAYEVRDLAVQPSVLTVGLVRVQDGVPLAPDVLFAAVDSLGWETWSPDGRWLDVHATIDGDSRQFLVRVDDGAPPAGFEIDAQVDYLVFAPDSNHAYVAHFVGGALELARVELSGDEPGPLETVVEPTLRIAPGYPEDFTGDLGAMLLGGLAGGQASQLLVDLGGPLPADPVVVSAPLAPGVWTQYGELSPDDAFAIYIERGDVFGPERLMVVDLARPGTAATVMDGVAGWRAIPADG